jgi:3-dehydroquinate synthase
MGLSLFHQLEENVAVLKNLDRQSLLAVVARCVALKAQVVAGDERDLGQYRILLNYGHTLGHAIEKAVNYEMLHGDAVAVGMSVEAALAVRLGMATPDVRQRQNELLTRFGLPTRLPTVAVERLLELINYDKKVLGGAQSWILPVAIGRAVVFKNVNEGELVELLREHSS